MSKDSADADIQRSPLKRQRAHRSERAKPRARTVSPMPRPVVIVLAVLVFTAFVMLLNETTLVIALPAMMEDFTITADIAQWLLTGFMLTMAVVLPATGWILERFSTRAVFAFASAAFLAGAIVAAIAPTFEILLIGRVAQAVGTAIIMPLLMTVTMTVVPAPRRGTIMGLISVVMAVGPALGPVVAGIVLNFTTWHGIFWVMVPLVAVATVIGIIWLSDIGERKRTAFDFLSQVLAVFAFGGLVYALSSMRIIGEGGHMGLIVLIVLGVGVVALALFIWRQLALGRRGAALLDLRPLKVRNFTLSMTVMVLLFGAMIGVFSTLPLYFQGSLLLTALVAGLVMLPGGLVEAVLSPIAGRFFDVYGPRPLVIPGLVIELGAFLWLSTFNEHTSVAVVITVHVLTCIAFAMLFTPLLTTALGSLPQRQYSHGSAILNTLQQLAAAAGTALLIGIYSAVSIDAQAAGAPEPVALANGARAAFLVASGVIAVALILSLFITRVPVRSPGEDSESETTAPDQQ